MIMIYLVCGWGVEASGMRFLVVDLGDVYCHVCKQQQHPVRDS